MKIVFDSGLFMNVNKIPIENQEVYITESAMDEIKSSLSRNIFNLFEGKNKVFIVNPKKSHISHVNKISKENGISNLSEQDLEIIALANMLSEFDDVMIYTDDYGVKNLALILGLKVKSIKTTKGNEIRKYYYICLGCGTKSNSHRRICDSCGHNKFKRAYHIKKQI